MSEGRAPPDRAMQTTTDNPSEELNVMVDDLLNDLTSKFNSATSEITAKMDDMSRRIDNLEASMQAQRSENESQAS